MVCNEDRRVLGMKLECPVWKNLLDPKHRTGFHVNRTRKGSAWHYSMVFSRNAYKTVLDNEVLTVPSPWLATTSTPNPTLKSYPFSLQSSHSKTKREPPGP